MRTLIIILIRLALISLASLSNALAATPVGDGRQFITRDAARCLVATDETSSDGERAAYCASLSPAIRRTRCTEHAMDSPANRRTWCLDEWQNKSPVGVVGSMRLTGETEFPIPDTCEDPDTSPCLLCPASPIVIDIYGDGFAFTDAANGVLFDLRAKRQPEQFAWTVPESDDGWLVLDRNRNGAIDDGLEMFGNYTCQRPSDNSNGFIALAEFDDPAAGGNLDSIIDTNDAVYARLRVWQDRNHNGKSESSEFAELQKLGIVALSLDYSISTLRDEHGNSLRYRAEVRGAKGARVGQFAYDVFLVAGPAPAPSAMVAPQAVKISFWECRATCESRLLPKGDPSTCTIGRIATIGESNTPERACIIAKAKCLAEASVGDCILETGTNRCPLPPDPNCKRIEIEGEPPSCKSEPKRHSQVPMAVAPTTWSRRLCGGPRESFQLTNPRTLCTDVGR